MNTKRKQASKKDVKIVRPEIVGESLVIARTLASERSGADHVVGITELVNRLLVEEWERTRKGKEGGL